MSECAAFLCDLAHFVNNDSRSFLPSAATTVLTQTKPGNLAFSTADP